MKGFGAEPEIVWHYTQGEKLFPIGDSQLLKADMGYVPRGDQPVVWFTRSEIFDPCAYPEYVSPNGIRGMLTSLKEVAEKGKGLLRIGIAADNSCLKSFTHWSNSRQFQEYTESVIKLAYEKGSKPESDWFVSYKPVTKKRWKYVQLALPEDVTNDGIVTTWREWDFRSDTSKELFSAYRQSLIQDDCDDGKSCSCC